MTMKKLFKIYGMPQKQILEVSSEQYMPSLKRKSQINNTAYYLKELEKEEQTKPKISKKKGGGIIKIREEINKIEIQKNNRKKSIKARAGPLKS